MTSAAIAIMIAKTTKAIPIVFNTFIMALTTISVSLTFLTMIFWISLFKRSSILILKAFDKSFNCSGLGAGECDQSCVSNIRQV